ncbi:MAG: ketoisovalerate oxidoreductase [Nitrospiraceae bacterium]|nr:ketoisovalerate oxidoreductase [Nitrospiraceae bacterium]
MRYEIRIIGSAGQGSILAAVVLASAAAEAGRFATQTASYGSAMRSGISMGDVIISDTPIDFPKTLNLDIVVIQSQEAYDNMVDGRPVRFDLQCGEGNADSLADVKIGATVIADKNLVRCDLLSERYNIILAPMSKTATDTIGKKQVANMVALGVLRKATNILPQEAFLKAIEKSVPKRFIDINKKAFLAGGGLI